MASVTIFQISPQNIQEITQLQSSITIESLTQSGGIVKIGSIAQTVPFNASWNNITEKPEYLNYIADLSSSAQVQIDSKANDADVTSALALKADKTYVDAQDALKADTSYVNTQLGLKANSSDVTTFLATKANTTYVDTQDANLQSQITSAASSISAKANTTYVDIADTNLQSQINTINTAVSNKANISYVDSQVSTLQTQINTANTNISAKANTSYVDSQDALKENTANKATTMTGNTTSNTLFLTAKAIYDWAVGLFAPISSPALTGTPTAPTATVGTNTTQIATTAYVMNAVVGGIDLSSYATLAYVNAGLAVKANSTSPTLSDATLSGTTTTISSTNTNILGTVALPATTSIGTVSSTELSYVDGVTSSIQTQLNTKAATTYVDSQDALKANIASPTFTGTVTLPSTTSIGNVSATEIGYVDGVTSSIQTQLDSKVNKSGDTMTGALLINGETSNKALEFKRSGFTGSAHFRLVGNSGTEALGTFVNGNEIARATYDGKVGIGIDTPTTQLHVHGDVPSIFSTTTLSGADTGGYLYFGGNDGVTPTRTYAAIKGVKENSTSGNYASYLSFLTRANGGTMTEQVRISSSGNVNINNGVLSTYSGRVGIGTATPAYDVHSIGQFWRVENTDTTNALGWFVIRNTSTSAGVGLLNLSKMITTTDTTGYFLTCTNGLGSTQMRVMGNGNLQNLNNSYGAVSDIKLKENIEDTTPKLEQLNKVKIKNYNLIGDDLKQIGVVAQELEEVFPGMVEEIPDYDAEGNNLGTTTKAVKYSVFVPILIKSVQELSAKVKELEEKLGG